MINLPTVIIPDSLIKNVSALLPTLTSLPSILLSTLPTNLTMLPEVKLPEITVPGLRLTIGKILHDLPATLNMTQGFTDWLDTHTTLLGGKAADDDASASFTGAVAAGSGGVSLNVTHPVLDGGLAAAVEQMAGAKGIEAPVKADTVAAPSQQEAPAAAAAVPAAAADAAPADAAAAADAPVEAVVAGAPIQEVEVKAT
jgi:phosphoribosylformylglycinamidine (FGAM) synthase-like enzyme